MEKRERAARGRRPRLPAAAGARPRTHLDVRVRDRERTRVNICLRLNHFVYSFYLGTASADENIT